jgi:hypothetical protein
MSANVILNVPCTVQLVNFDEIYFGTLGEGKWLLGRQNCTSAELVRPFCADTWLGARMDALRMWNKALSVGQLADNRQRMQDGCFDGCVR